MNRIAHLTLTLGIVGLLALLLALAAGAQPPAHAADSTSNTIKVPDDYATIQAAIDAAGDGDTILVRQDLYPENLSISKGITLSGGWDINFASRTPGESYIDGQGLGRVISITCATSDTVVIIDGFTILNGDATGLGGPPMAARVDFYGTEFTPTLPLADTLTPAEHATRLRTHLDDVAVRGLYPGGPVAYRAALAQVDRWAAQLEQAQARASSRATADQSKQVEDVGGGVYSWNARLHLLNCTVEHNVASQSNAGYGGGVFVGQAALSPFGGGVGVIVEGNTIRRNVASTNADGFGGGCYIRQAPGAVFMDNLFLENAGTNAGDIGIGGGMMVDFNTATLLLNNRLERNTANASWTGLFGLGGGAYMRGSNFSAVIANTFRGNLAGLHCSAGGGGLYMYDVQIGMVTENQVYENWACFTYGPGSTNGGGMGIDSLYDAQVTENAIWGNTASADTLIFEGGHGGGIWGALCLDTLVATNTITSNVGSLVTFGRGGGAFFIATENLVVAGNTIADNVGSLSDSHIGVGGGLHLRNTTGSLVQRNRIQGNRAGTDASGSGGGFCVEGWGPYSFDATVDGNLILDNQANANPAFLNWGGGCEVHWTEGFTLTNNVVAGNTAVEGAGVNLGMSWGNMVNNTVAGNVGTGVQVRPSTSPERTIALVNNIVVSHTIGITVSEGATATVRYTLWHGNETDIGGPGTFTHTNPVSGPPAFVDPVGDDYHIGPGSAARDAGDPVGVPPAPPLDLDGDVRPQGADVDLGADEWRGFLIYLLLIAKG